MAKSIWTTEEFACPNCGMDYQATREEHQDRRSGSFKCRVCDTDVYAWSGHHDYFNWQAIKSRSPIFGKKK
jgi:predicted SprT family Zn-dependent metalloprotease